MVVIKSGDVVYTLYQHRTERCGVYETTIYRADRKLPLLVAKTNKWLTDEQALKVLKEFEE